MLSTNSGMSFKTHELKKPSALVKIMDNNSEHELDSE